VIKTINKEALSALKMKMREYKRKFKEFIKIKSLRTNMEKLRLISSQIIRREKLKLRINMIDQEIFEKNSENIRIFLRNIKEKPENHKKKTFKLLKKSIRKSRFSSSKIMKINRISRLKNGEILIKAPNNISKFEAKSRVIRLKIKEKNKARKNKLLKLIRKTTNSLIPSQNLRKNGENPNEPSDSNDFLQKKRLKCELKGLVRTQNSKELSLFNEINKKSAINKKALRSINVKRKLRSNKLYRYHF